MNTEPGKYDNEVRIIQSMCGRNSSVVLMVVNGYQGTGFSVATINPDFDAKLPQLLRLLADKIEQERVQNE